MMSAKLATPSFLKIKIFLNKSYDVIFLSITSPTNKFDSYYNTNFVI